MSHPFDNDKHDEQQEAVFKNNPVVISNGLDRSVLEKNDPIWAPQPGPQTFLLSCPIEDIFFGGARGGGKSDALIGDWLAHEARYRGDASGIIFRRTFSELEQLLKRMQQLFPRLGASYQRQERTWKFLSGAELKMRYLMRPSDAENYQGHEYTWIGFDELGNWETSEGIDMLRACLRSPAPNLRKRFVCSANPGGKGHEWIKKRYITPANPLTPFYSEEDEVWRVFIPSRVDDNKILVEADPDYKKRLKGSGPDWLVKAWLEGDWNISIQGEIFLREWWNYYNPDQALPYAPVIVQSWDTAFKAGESNDRSVCVTAKVIGRAIYITDVTTGRWNYPALKKKAKSLSDRFKPTDIVIEDKASGQSLLQDLVETFGMTVHPIRPDSDKISRAYAETPVIEAGNVYLPSKAPWLDDFLSEVSEFPHGGHDDQVDALTQLIRRIRDRYMYTTMSGLSMVDPAGEDFDDDDYYDY